MKLRLRYVLVFLVGMACMYWMVRSGALVIEPIYRGSSVTTSDVVVEPMVDTWSPITTGEVMSGDVLSGSMVDTWVVQSGEVVSGDQTALDDTVAIIQWSGESDLATTSSSSDTKTVACTKSDGNYNNALIVWWNDVLTATAKSYVKRGSFLHYVVNVSDGSKYYFYHNCSNGTATNVQNLTATNVTRIVLSNGQVYLR